MSNETAEARARGLRKIYDFTFQKIRGDDRELDVLRAEYAEYWGVTPTNRADVQWVGAYFDDRLVSAIGTYVDVPTKEVDVMDVFAESSRFGRAAAYQLFLSLDESMLPGWTLFATVIAKNGSMYEVLLKYGMEPVTHVMRKEYT